MENDKCSTHGSSGVLYCMDCKKIMCTKCSPVGSCRADHKKADVKEVAMHTHKEREKDAENIAKLFTEIVHLELKLGQETSKLAKLNKPKYLNFLGCLNVIQERIEFIKQAKAKLPSDAQECLKLVNAAKINLLDATMKSKDGVEYTRKCLDDSNFLGVMLAKSIEIPDISPIQKEYFAFEMDNKQLFGSLKTIGESFLLQPSAPISPATANQGVQTEDLKPKVTEEQINFEIKTGFEEIIKAMANSNKELIEKNNSSLLEAWNVASETKFSQIKEEQKHHHEDKLKETLAEMQSKVLRIVEEKVGKFESQLKDKKDAGSIEALMEEKMKKMIEANNLTWKRRMTEFETAINDLAQGKSDIQPEKKKKELQVPDSEIKLNNLELHFGSFMNLQGIKDFFKGSDERCKVYIFGIKNGFGAAELATLIHELKGKICNTIQAVTLDHMYFKDLSPFTHLLQSAGNLVVLQLLHCPFSSGQVQYIIEKIGEYGPGVKRLVIENAFFGDQAKELARAINKTQIKELRLSNPKIDLTKYVTIFKEFLNDNVEVIDFGELKIDSKTKSILQDWQKKKRVLYTTPESFS